MRALIDEANERAVSILTEKRDTLNALAKELEQKEVLDGEEVQRITAHK